MSDHDRFSEEAIDDLAIRFLTRTTNAWLSKGLPLSVVARAMVAAGTAGVQIESGAAGAREALEEIGDTIKEFDRQAKKPN